MPSLQMRLGIQSDASYLQRNSCASKSNPAEAGCWDFWKEMQPSTRNLYPFQSNPTHWVAHNQDSSFLADAPKNRKSWANTSYPRLAFRFTRTEWENQDASDRPEMEDRNSPCPLILYPGRSPRTKKPWNCKKVSHKIAKFHFWSVETFLFGILFCKKCKMIGFDVAICQFTIPNRKRMQAISFLFCTCIFARFNLN